MKEKQSEQPVEDVKVEENCHDASADSHEAQLVDDTQETTDDTSPAAKKVDKVSWLITAMVILMRLAVGGVFVFSGFVKAIDPWGSYYKFNEYLNALGWDSLLGLSTFGAFTLAAIEFAIGVMLVTGSCRRFAPIFSSVFVGLMLPLTLWLAITDKVPDCGCFGDYLVLSNWATFGKNVVLLAGSVYLLVLNKRVPCVYGPAVQWMVIVLSALFPLALSFVGYFTQPLLDFRPYKVGSKLESKATSVDGDDYIFIYEKDGVQQEFSIDSVPDEDNGWQYVDRRVVARVDSTNVKPGLSIAAWDNDDDMSDELLSHEQLLLILLPDVDKVSVSYTFLINELQDYADQHGVYVAALTSAVDEEIAEWNDISMAHYPIYNDDDSEIKMLARGNPAVVYIRNKEIVWKRTLVSIDPELIHEGEKSIAQFSDDFKPQSILKTLVWTYLLSLLSVLLVNRIHKVFVRSKKE